MHRRIVPPTCTVQERLYLNTRGVDWLQATPKDENGVVLPGVRTKNVLKFPRDCQTHWSQRFPRYSDIHVAGSVSLATAPK